MRKQIFCHRFTVTRATEGIRRYIVVETWFQYDAGRLHAHKRLSSRHLTLRGAENAAFKRRVEAGTTR